MVSLMYYYYWVFNDPLGSNGELNIKNGGTLSEEEDDDDHEDGGDDDLFKGRVCVLA